LVGEPESESGQICTLRRINLAAAKFMAWHTALLLWGAAMPIDSYVQPGAFDPEAIAAMSEAFDAACKEVQDTSHPEVAHEIIARRIIAAALLGERDPVRLMEAALTGPRGR
jgi:hypothetical protein